VGGKPDHLAHRERLRRRFLDAGDEALPDYELLELVLFLTQARRDVKPLAKRLIRHFGSFAEVLSAESERLVEVEGVGENTAVALKTVQAAAQRLARGRALKRPVLGSWQAVLDHCQASMGYEKSERFRILFLDRKNVLIADEVQQRGTVDHTPVYPREVVKRALELGASAIIMVHNHPSGDPTPSKADIEMTREVAAAGAKLGISLHDHIIVGRGDYASFKTLGLM
jgi:DNA repair protein RadC